MGRHEESHAREVLEVMHFWKGIVTLLYVPRDNNNIDNIDKTVGDFFFFFVLLV